MKSPAYSVTSAAVKRRRTATVATLTTNYFHGFSVGQSVTVTNSGDAQLDITATITAITQNSFTYTVAAGSAYSDTAISYPYATATVSLRKVTVSAQIESSNVGCLLELGVFNSTSKVSGKSSATNTITNFSEGVNGSGGTNQFLWNYSATTSNITYSTVNISTAAGGVVVSAGVATVTTAAVHGLQLGDIVSVSKLTGTLDPVNGSYVVASIPTTTTFTISIPSSIADASYTVSSGAVQVVPSRLGPSNLRITSSNAAWIGSSSDPASNIGSMRTDITSVSMMDEIQISYISLDAASPTFTITMYDTAGNTMAKTITHAGGKGYFVSKTAISTWTISASFNYRIAAIKVATSSSSGIEFDAFNIYSVGTNTTETGLVSHALLPYPIVKYIGDTISVEYSLQVDI
jgi:hypothetical protein